MAFFNLNEFKNTVTTPQRSNKFRVNIFRHNEPYNEKITFHAEQVQFPTTTLVPRISVNRTGFGLADKFPSQPEYKDLIVNFIFDRGGTVYKYFHDWMNQVYNFNRTTVQDIAQFETEYKDTYSAVIDLQLLSETESLPDEPERASATWRFRNAYPIGLNGEPLSWALPDEYLAFFVNFDFYQIEYIEGGEPPKPFALAPPRPILQRREDYFENPIPLLPFFIGNDLTTDI